MTQPHPRQMPQMPFGERASGAARLLLYGLANDKGGSMNGLVRWMHWAASLGIALGVAGCDGGVCEAFLNEPGTTVTIRLKNERAEPIFIGSRASCFDAPPFTLRNVGNQILDIGGSGCGSSCEGMQEHGLLTCADACSAPSMLMIAPGGHFETTWDGRLNHTVTMPAECVKGIEEQDRTCTQRVTAPRSLYQVSAQAFLDVRDCGALAGPCSCKPSADGSCDVLDPGAVGPASLTMVSSLNYPDESTVELVFQ
ncbi:hypothetical protein [Polyangium aurulentum]|uniref:hypothetical protein n=1 Tax=Polyangium aurulentum TaxID=2567896 RepID=UPI0010AE7703|nr:hypothetical protein [Polyangium aurulentum]UQA61340.1 hypothetical protein E8A73_013040 [Polyangium aurulentum]